MELFAAAGIDLPAVGSGPTRRAAHAARTLHAPLFSYKVVQEAATRTAAFQPTPEQLACAQAYARKVRDPKFLKQKETAVRGRLIEEVLQTVLGYTPFDPTRAYTLAIERPIRAGAVDVALGAFNSPDAPEEIVAPFELKGPGTIDLDRVMPGRGRSPVQQAWDYAVDAPGSRWVLVSNCLEIRMYAFGRGRDVYESVDLTKLDERAEHERLWSLLGADQLLGGRTDQLLRETDSAYKDVTTELYREYSGLRGRLIDFLRNPGDGPGLGLLQAVEIAQKLLDRILFIAFAQRTDLMPDRLLEKAAVTQNSFAPRPLWDNFLGLFRFVDVGHATLGIPPYNGGLFAHDPVADAITLPDHLAEEIARLGQWDYRREVPVTVLGRLFEQSITDIETLKSPGAVPAVSRRKREGVVYTPDAITRFLVERTLGLTLDARRAALWRDHGMGADAPSPESQESFWQAYLDALRRFTVVDPACGSGAFLVAAFDEMARRYREAASALEGLEIEVGFDLFDEIVSRNLHGVDLNPESVEITRLSLWLKTARRNHPLQRLEATIKVGDSLIADPAHTARPFDWRAAFPEVSAGGGFDVVIGNPPYVRMELLKEVKPYLARTYVVADDRTDLYAYFFEKGVEMLKPGGRLGYISSSTFFKTGSGEKLRTFLGDQVTVEAVIDFGDVQLFEGVTTYPAILTLQKDGEAPSPDVRYLTVRGAAPEDLGRAFARDGATMPRARLGAGSWRFEDDALAALRDKLTAGRPTLGEVYGSPLYGIKTELNEAFVIDRETRDRLVAADPKSVDLLVPFLRGEDIRRWRVESRDLFLINTPKGRVDIEAYPAVRAWLAPFRDRLEARATKQAWWELQQAQLAYQPLFAKSKVCYQDITATNPFTLDSSGAFLAKTCYFVPTGDNALLALLNSKLAWLLLSGITNVARGGYLRLRSDFVETLPIPANLNVGQDLAKWAESSSSAAAARLAIQQEVRRRIFDLAPADQRRLGGKLEAWPTLSFAQFLAEVKKAFGADIPLKRRGEWAAYLAENGAEVRRLSGEIAAAEREIDRIVYRLFDLTPKEITLLEAAVA